MMKLHNIQIEQNVLTALMTINDAYAQFGDGMSEAMFFAERHKLIFSTIRTLVELKKSPDFVMVAEHLQSRGELDRAGGEDYFKELIQSGGTLYSMDSYIQRLHELSIRRAAEQSLQHGLDQIRNNPDAQAADVVNNTVSALVEANTIGDESKLVGIKEALRDLFHDIETSAGDSCGHKTGFIELDNVIGGLEAGRLVIIAARPSMGKTAFALNIVNHVVRTSKQAGLVFSLEMDTRSITRRIIAADAAVTIGNLRERTLSERDWEAVTRSSALLSDSGLMIDDRSGATVSYIRTTANKVRRQSGQLSCIMVDYLQIMGGISAENRVNGIGEVTRALKALGKEMGCPIILLSQLSRDVEKRPNKRPLMSDLRESGAIEQDADLIMMLYRDEYYTKEQSKFKGLAEVIVGKQRDGATGTVFLGFEGQYARFTNHVGYVGYAGEEE